MKWLIGYDDGVYYHRCIVEAPKDAEIITLFEIALTEFNCGSWIRADYYENEYFQQLLGWGYSEEDAREWMNEFSYSKKLG